MKYDDIKTAWNAQADEHNQWDELGEDEKIEWAARFGAATERAARQKAQEEVVFLKERIARSGVEHRRARAAPLTDEALDAMRQADNGQLNFVSLKEFRIIARAVERAHGIHPDTP